MIPEQGIWLLGRVWSCQKGSGNQRRSVIARECQWFLGKVCGCQQGSGCQGGSVVTREGLQLPGRVCGSQEVLRLVSLAKVWIACEDLVVREGLWF